MKGKSRVFTVLPSAARTTSLTHSLDGLPGEWDEIVGYLDVTAASGTTPTLDIDYQTTADNGTTFFTHTSFTQATAATTERKVFTAPVGVDGRFNITIGGTTPSFTFSLRLECKRNS